ncbi:TPA: tail assembly chaperone [Pseudomonas aeruginosa]|uniref:tail fiber assembly protein n=1 Tax=Pseudomonas aeruginosa TaxID=287 RepID=UPI00053DE487|nr:tail assembly chaperone [Pseudomonas aeruginosa]EIU5455941.1 tail assembly chaperone [Pseudomonas aeruginosa]EIU5544048.1 tail assembly chaperone [Pseudomonas aeruginosa]EKW4494523.1 tail assembly chaperone [Pseudomonas aeruginosa]EKY0078600.1 tail assembly chaperone [Pseudomonas aeruginosa]EKY0500370.1 tail assembly chaperone [Pseudomonas aeruginosa]
MEQLTVYHADRQTGEFLGTGHAELDPREPGNWLIPAHAYLDAPPESGDGQVARRAAGNDGWELVEDHRGPIYATSNGERAELVELGPIPDGYTITAPPGPFYRWSGTTWELDEQAERTAQVADVEKRRDTLLQEATLRIAPLQDAIDLDEATQAEVVELKAWKQYRVALNRVDQQAGYPSLVEWPVPPA